MSDADGLGAAATCSSCLRGPRADRPLGHRDRDQADRARPRPQGRHRAGLPGDGRRRRRPRSRRTRSTARSRSSASAPTRSASPSPRSRGSAPTRSRSGCPNVQNAAQAIQQVGHDRAALLLRLGSRTSIPPPNSSAPEGSAADGPGHERPTSTPSRNLYEAVKFASKQKPECFQQQVHDERAARYYLFDTQDPRLLAGPAENNKDLLLHLPEQKQPAGTRRSSGAPGHGGGPGGAARSPRSASSPSENSRRRWFVIKDRPGALRHRHHRTRSRTSTDDQPAQRHLQLHRRRADGVPGRHPADRPARAATAPRRRAAPRRPTSTRSHFAVVLDNEVSLAADHQLRREPRRDRRPHRRPDLRRLHASGGAGPGEVPPDRRPAGRPEADQPEHGLGDARPAGARPGAARPGSSA